MAISGIQNNEGMNYSINVVEKGKQTDEKNTSKTGLNINADNLNLAGDQNNKLKELFGQKAALKLQLDQFKQDSKIDDSIKNHIEKGKKALEEAGVNQNQVNQLNKLKKDLKDSYGVEDDSQEQKDLELLEKQAENKIPLTKVEKDRIAHMGPLTEYQTASLDYTKMSVEFQNRADDAMEQYINENRSVNAIKLERLKDDPMVDVKKDAKNLLDKVDGEIQQAIVEELRNKVNENLDVDPNKSILQDPQTLVDQKKVTEEDLKGLAVDEKV
jgi:hypothetical protein